AGARDVLLGSSLDERAVGGRAVRRDAAATDADPDRRELGLTLGVLVCGRHGPLAGDVRERRSCGYLRVVDPDVVPTPVARGVGVHTAVQDVHDTVTKDS